MGGLLKNKVKVSLSVLKNSKNQDLSKCIIKGNIVGELGESPSMYIIHTRAYYAVNY